MTSGSSGARVLWPSGQALGARCTWADGMGAPSPERSAGGAPPPSHEVSSQRPVASFLRSYRPISLLGVPLRMRNDILVLFRST